jgi:hypothetical protein
MSAGERTKSEGSKSAQARAKAAARARIRAAAELRLWQGLTKGLANCLEGRAKIVRETKK